jgi:hypothetical protein
LIPQHDIYHEPVKLALVKDGWRITADPFVIHAGERRLYADLGAEKDVRLIVVEIKSFVGDSFINELHRATGQYSNYRSLLRGAVQQYEIYLAVPHSVFQKHFDKVVVEGILKDQQIKFFTFDPEKKEIVQWSN